MVEGDKPCTSTEFTDSSLYVAVAREEHEKSGSEAPTISQTVSPAAITVANNKEGDLLLDTARYEREMEVAATIFDNNGKHMHFPEQTTADYDKGRELGCGSFSKVYIVRERATGVLYACKRMSKEQLIREGKCAAAVRERNILAHMRFVGPTMNPSVAELHSCFEDLSSIFFIMQLGGAGDLHQLIQRVNCMRADCAAFIAAEILNGLNFIHSLNIIHRDVKPGNVLVKADGHFMLTDFGSARFLGPLVAKHPIVTCETEKMRPDTFIIGNGEPNERVEAAIKRQNVAQAQGGGEQVKRSRLDSFDEPMTRRRMFTFVGTPTYVSPEVLSDEPIGPWVDHWALACIIYEMLAGQPPFRAINNFRLLRNINEMKYDFPRPFDENGEDLVKKILVRTTTARLGYRSSSEIMNHPFFSCIDWTTIATGASMEIQSRIIAEDSEGKGVTSMGPSTGDSRFDEMSEVESKLAHKLSLPSYENDQDMTEAVTKKKYYDRPPVLPNCNPDFDPNAPGADDDFGIKEILPCDLSKLTKRKRMLDAQRENNVYHQFVDGNLILKSGFLEKKRGLFARRRMFLLTEGPHLYYVDTTTMELKGEIPWTPDMTVERKGFSVFHVVTPMRVYILTDPECRSDQWSKAILDVKSKYIKKITECYDAMMVAGTFGLSYMKGDKLTEEKRRLEKKKNIDNTDNNKQQARTARSQQRFETGSNRNSRGSDSESPVAPVRRESFFRIFTRFFHSRN